MGPGCTHQPCTPSRVAVVIRCGPVHRPTYCHRFRNRGTSCNIPPPVSQLRYSMQSTRWIGCGPGFIELHPEPGCSCDPLRAGIHRVTPRAGLQLRSAAGRDSSSYTPNRVAVVFHGARLHAPTTHQPRKPGRVAVVIHGAGTRCSPLDGLNAGRDSSSYTPNRVATATRCGPCFDLLTIEIKRSLPLRVSDCTHCHRFCNRGTSCNAHRAGLQL
jgi:hypothetical protein